MRSTPFILLSLFLLLSCHSESTQTPPVEEQLLVQLKAAPSVQAFLETHPNAYISQELYCQDGDCIEMLRKAGFDLPVYTREKAFMRALQHAILISQVDIDAGVPSLVYQLRINNKVMETGTITL